MWDDSFGVFADREHRGFDMDMTVEETRGDIQPAGVDDFGRFTDAGAGVADEGNAAFCDGDVETVEDLSGADIDEPAAADDGVSRSASLSDISEGLSDVPERAFAKMVDHGWTPFAGSMIESEMVTLEVEQAFVTHL